jgi:anthranilate phosphoribosyltransferase
VTGEADSAVGSELDDGAAFIAAGGWPFLLGRLFRREDLNQAEAEQVLGEVLTGRADPSCVAALLAGLRTKGETVEELSGFLAALRAHGDKLVVPGEVIDTCGTGGDRSGSINVSTTAAFVAAGAGALVAKHGGRAASSRSGSADVLEALGVAIELGPAGVLRCIEEVGIGFCFAPRFHPAMRFAGPVRRALGVATMLNFVAPLANPAGARRQVVGIGDPLMAEKVLGVLEASETLHAMVFYGHDGLDEISTVTTSVVFETSIDADGQRVRSRRELDPTAFGIARARPADLLGGDPAHNAQRVRAVLEGERGPQRDIVLLNAAAALVVAGIASDFPDGLATSGESIDSGAALRALDGLIATSTAAALEEAR